MGKRIVVFYVLTWFFIFLLGGAQQAGGLLGTEISLAQLGPGIAALLMLAIFRKDGQRLVFISQQTPVTRYLLAALIPVGVNLIVLLLRSWLPIEMAETESPYGSLLLAVIWMPLGALGEEIGWRGYLHKVLDPRLRGLLSSLIVGLLWFPIHIHFFSEGYLFVLFLALLILSYSVVMYALVHDTGFNVLAATIFHLAINLTNLLFLDVIYEFQFMVLNASAWMVTAVITVFLKREIFLAPKK